MQFYCPQKCTFFSTSGHKTLSYHEKLKTLFQMYNTIGMVRPRQFIEPGLVVSTYFDIGSRLFSTQWPTYDAHILQGLQWRLYTPGSLGQQMWLPGGRRGALGAVALCWLRDRKYFLTNTQVLISIQCHTTVGVILFICLIHICHKVL